MNPKKMLQAWATAFIVMYVISVIWYLWIISSYNEVQFAAVAKDPMNMFFITVGYLVQSFLLAYIYPLGYKGGAPLQEGLRFGLIMGVFWTIGNAFIFSGAYNFPIVAQLVDAVYHVAEVTIASIALAMVYGSGDSAAGEG